MNSRLWQSIVGGENGSIRKRILFIAIFFGLLATVAVRAETTEPETEQVFPKGPVGLEFVSGHTVSLNMNVVAWGPHWGWMSVGVPPQVIDSTTLHMAQDLSIGPDHQPLNVSYQVSQKNSQTLEISIELSCPENTPLTGIIFSLHPQASSFTSLDVGSAGEPAHHCDLPLHLGQVGVDASQILLHAWDGTATTVDISPARYVSSENKEMRIWVAKDQIPSSQPLKTTLTIHFPSSIHFIADEKLAVVRHITPDWFFYSVGKYGTPINLSFLNKDAHGNYIPAGAHGFVRVKGDNFVFDDGTPARFWGVNVTAAAAVPSPARAQQIAERLARLGINVVRLHHLDSDWNSNNIIDRHSPDGTTQHLNPEHMRELDRMIYELKSRGIYVILDPWVGRTFLPGDDVPGSDHFSQGNYHMHPYIFFDQRIQELHKKFLEEVWNHVNPFTHLAYKDDPALALTEICNEFLYNGNITLEPYRSEYYKIYERWAMENGANPTIGDSIFTQNYPRDNQRFYIYIMQTFFKDFHDYDRQLGIKIPINDSNWFHFPWEIACQADGDFMDSHFYYGGDRIGSGSGLGGLWVEHPPGVIGGPFGTIGAMALLGKPLTSSEYGNNPPKTYRSAYYVGMAAVACLQGWDSLTAFAYTQSPQPVGTLSSYEMESDPATIASLAAGALIYRRQDVSPAKELAIMTLPNSESFAMHWQNDGAAAYQNTVGFNAALETHKVAVVFGDESQISPDVHPAEIMTPASAFAEKPASTELRSDTGELWRDWKLGVGTIDSPRTQAAYGRLGDLHKPLQTRDCSFDISTPYATVVLSSVTNAPIRESSHLLLTAVARAENRGMSFDLAMDHIVDHGTPPVLVEPVVGTVKFKTSASQLIAWPIGDNGVRQQAIPLHIENGEAALPLSASDETLFYEIAVK